MPICECESSKQDVHSSYSLFPFTHHFPSLNFPQEPGTSAGQLEPGLPATQTAVRQPPGHALVRRTLPPVREDVQRQDPEPAARAGCDRDA